MLTNTTLALIQQNATLKLVPLLFWTTNESILICVLRHVLGIRADGGIQEEPGEDQGFSPLLWYQDRLRVDYSCTF